LTISRCFLSQKHWNTARTHSHAQTFHNQTPSLMRRLSTRQPEEEMGLRVQFRVAAPSRRHKYRRGVYRWREYRWGEYRRGEYRRGEYRRGGYRWGETLAGSGAALVCGCAAVATERLKVPCAPRADTGGGDTGGGKHRRGEALTGSGAALMCGCAAVAREQFVDDKCCGALVLNQLRHLSSKIMIFLSLGTPPP